MFLDFCIDCHRGFIATVAGVQEPRSSASVRRRSMSIEIPLPPLEEQKRIAAILDQADSLRRLRQRAIDRLNTLGQAIFYEMFGDPDVATKGRLTTRSILGRVTVAIGGNSAYYQDGIPVRAEYRTYGIDFDESTSFSSLKSEKLGDACSSGDVLLSIAQTCARSSGPSGARDVLISTSIRVLIQARFLVLCLCLQGKRNCYEADRGQGKLTS